jgi:DNA mismatch repair protein MutS2
MNQKAFKVLEYNKIIDLLMQEAASQLAKKVIEEMKPLVDEYQIKELLAETTEAVLVIINKGAPPIGAFYDIENSLHLANKGGSLTMKQLLEILYNINTASRAINFLKSELPPLPIIKGLGEVLFTDKYLAENIDRCIVSEDEMADNASSELKSIRRAIIRQNESIKSKMTQILNSSDNRTMLQDSIVTMRQGRYVIPVKLEHKSRFPGIIHDQSATGATLFIEPQAIVTLNNELRQLELDERVEVERILAELSSQVAEDFLQLINNQKLLLKLDVIFAKGKLSCKQKASEAKINDEGFIKMVQARHPLINANDVVPINIEFGKQNNTLVITGPNTGGKTVTLKTVGLLAMMNQSGLHIPVAEGSEMPVFKKIYADIGDEQSIEQSLSTFSSHMNNIVEIVENTDSETLVLLDELGAGTDPTEGAALAISILDDLYGKGARTMATTHYTELKKYALATPGVENASMEFNVETLRPTYRLFLGIPGKSNAFEISLKIGLKKELIEKARSLIDRGEIEFETVISTIEADKKKAEIERDEAISLKIAMQRQKEDFDRRQSKLEEKQEAIVEKARQEAKDIIRDAKQIVEQVQKELREMKQLEKSSDRQTIFEDTRKKLRDTEAKLRVKDILVENDNPIKLEEIKIGERVKLVNLNQNGEILTMPDDKGDLQVQVGNIKINTNMSTLMLIIDGTKKKPQPKKSKYASLYKYKTQEVSMSINVIGRNLDDAILDVDKYLDDAYISGLSEVTVIHGRGTGILRDGLAQMFKKHKHVDSFRKGSFNEGGDGVTICTLSARV